MKKDYEVLKCVKCHEYINPKTSFEISTTFSKIKDKDIKLSELDYSLICSICDWEAIEHNFNYKDCELSDLIEKYTSVEFKVENNMIFAR